MCSSQYLLILAGFVAVAAVQAQISEDSASRATSGTRIVGIRNLGVIAGGDGVFCDAFYWTQFHKLCDGKTSCSIPLSEEICSVNGKSYGKLNPKGGNILHANWLCTAENGNSTFYSADLQEGAGTHLHMFCPLAADSHDQHEEEHEQELARPDNDPVHFFPPRKLPSTDAAADGNTIMELGVVLGSPGSAVFPQGYCDQYFSISKLCAGKSRCTFAISETYCNVGKPAMNPLTQVHAMFSCAPAGSMYQRINVPLHAGNVTLSC